MRRHQQIAVSAAGSSSHNVRFQFDTFGGAFGGIANFVSVICGVIVVAGSFRTAVALVVEDDSGELDAFSDMAIAPFAVS